MKSETVNPKDFGLHHSTDLVKTGTQSYLLTITRKSRVIMKDGQILLDKIKKIKSVERNATVSVKISAPLCSKTRTFLVNEGINLIQD